MFFAPKKLIGLDIGTSTIKMAEMEISKKGLTLVSFAVASTPPNAIGGGEIVDAGAVSSVIASLHNEIKSKRKNICTAMWGTAVIVKRIGIPKMDPKLVAEQVRWEAEQYIPFDINEINLSYNVLESHSRSSEMMELLLVAGKQDLVMQYAEVALGAGLQCSTIDVAGFALANCFEVNYGQLRGETVALFNIGAGVTNFVVIEDGEVIFCRDIPVGGSNYTNEIHKELGVPFEEAEALKISAGKGDVPTEVHSIISATNESVAEEIKNSVDFFMATTSGVNLSRCYYSGGGSLTPGLVDQISKNVGVKMERIDPWARIPCGNKSLSAAYLSQVSIFSPVVIGLAARQMGDS